jgi:hypothetical protein
LEGELLLRLEKDYFYWRDLSSSWRKEDKEHHLRTRGILHPSVVRVFNNNNNNSAAVCWMAVELGWCRYRFPSDHGCRISCSLWT